MPTTEREDTPIIPTTLNRNNMSYAGNALFNNQRQKLKRKMANSKLGIEFNYFCGCIT
jgi:hypothetical protein